MTSATITRTKLTWGMLTKLEPRLKALAREAWALRRTAKDDPTYCRYAAWYGYGKYEGRGFKERMAKLVGWDRLYHPILGTEKAYDIAYDYLLGILPRCKCCG